MIHQYSYSLTSPTLIYAISDSGWPKEGKETDREREKKKDLGWQTQASKHWSFERRQAEVCANAYGPAFTGV